MPIYRVMCEQYDKTWYVRARTEKKAVKLVKDMTEDHGWHLDFPDEERVFTSKKFFTEDNTIYDHRDL